MKKRTETRICIECGKEYEWEIDCGADLCCCSENCEKEYVYSLLKEEE